MNLNELQNLITEVNELTNGAYENIIKTSQIEFWDMLGVSELKHEEIANMVYFGSYNPSHEFIGFDGYGNIESMSKQEYYAELLKFQDEILKDLEQ